MQKADYFYEKFQVKVLKRESGFFTACLQGASFYTDQQLTSPQKTFMLLVESSTF